MGTFLANLKKKCSESDEEFDQRVKDRLQRSLPLMILLLSSMLTPPLTTSGRP